MAGTYPGIEMITKEQLHEYVKKSGWPAAPVLLEEVARAAGAPESFLEAITHLENRIYMNEKDLWQALH
ncbi:MAG TPA: hypothetical protein VFD42_05070 [Chloroflexota bacterium]|nr:hypothetical protein [Chloroflexota bacterium]